jgi:DNA-binding Xre family transcriptional regulator
MAFLRVRELVDARQWSRLHFSQQAQIPYPSVLAMYNDQLEQISRSTLIRAAKALEVRVGELFAEDAHLEPILERSNPKQRKKAEKGSEAPSADE